MAELKFNVSETEHVSRKVDFISTMIYYILVYSLFHPFQLYPQLL